MPKKKKVDFSSLEFQYACDNFAGVVNSVEYFENNRDCISKLPIEIQMLTVTGYYTALASLIKNSFGGMEYKKIFELWDKVMENNIGYYELNKGLRYNIKILKKWEESLEYEMKHILKIKTKYFAHIDFIEPGFLLKHFENKDTTK